MKIDTYFYLDNINTIEHFNLEGPQGNTGDRGYPGSQGMQGLQGRRGIRGKQGIKGDSGLQGYKGLSGYIGDDGAKGDDGIKGITGYQGYQGPRGNYGPAGDPGPIGIKGIDGLIGRQGYSGNKGPPGEDGEDGEKKPYSDDLQVSNWGWKNMSGFGTNIQQTTGQTINPLDQRFTVKYNYEQNQNKQMKCPPNSYLSAFGYFRKGPGGQDGGWCGEEWGENNECKKGWNRKNNFIGSGPNQWNNARPGMPYSYSSDCAKLM